MTRFDGADLSHHQDDAGPIDWAALRQASWWVATKATQGLNYVDPTFAAHRAQMAAQGFTHRLFYGWLSAHIDAIAQAHHFLDTIIPLIPPEGAMIDAEEAGITVADVLAWCRTVEAVTHRPVAVYTGAYVAGGTIWQSTEIRNSIYGERPMHLAAYTTEAKALALHGVKAYPWDAWQYSSNGPVPGIVGRCDMNRIDNRPAFDLACGISATPTPIPPSPGDDDMTENYYVVTGAAAKFIGTPARVRWTGPGDGKIEAAIAIQLDAGNLKQVDLTGGPNAFAATFLEGPLPTGDGWAWTGDEFANTNEIKARASQSPAIDPAVIGALNDAVGRLGQENAQIKSGLIKAGGG